MRCLGKEVDYAASGFAWWGLLVVIFVLFVLAAIAIPGYADYNLRASVSTAIEQSRPLQERITEIHARRGTLPGAKETPPLTAERQKGQSPTGARLIEWDVAQRALVVTLADYAGLGGKQLALEAKATPSGLEWHCRSITVEQKYGPAKCRD